MGHTFRLLAGVLFAASLAGCATALQPGDSDRRIDEALNQALNKACPIPPTAQLADHDRLRALRAQLVLASIAGYAVRSISSYDTGSDVKSDAALVLQRLAGAGEELARAVTAAEAENHLFPLYRTDVVIAAGSAAEAALRPTLRALRRTVTASTLDKLGNSKQMLVNLLVDELYRDAIEESCGRLNTALGANRGSGGQWSALPSLEPAKLAAARGFTDARLSDNCTGLKTLAGAAAHGCRRQWPAN